MEKIIIGNATLFHGDCREVIPTLGRVDAVITDPPYGIGIAANPVRQKHAKSDWDNEIPEQEVFNAIFAISEMQIIWGGNYFPLPPSQGFLIWDKMQPENFSLAMCEQAWISLQQPAKMFRKSVTSYAKEHPTQKPIELMKWCIRQAKTPKLILDPFMGSGTTGEAALDLGCLFIGIEKERCHFDTAVQRIERWHQQGQLF